MLVLLPLLIFGLFYLDRMDKKYVVYQHVTPDGMYYFGQTQNVEQRWSNNGERYKGTSLYTYIEKFGWDNIQHIVLFKDQTRENALFIENFLIETAQEDGVCINKNKSGLITKEEGYKQDYYEKNKDKLIQHQREYQKQNRDKIREYQEQNKDKINEQKRNYYERNKEKFKEYREQNKDKIREYNREYQEQNKDKIREYREQNKDKFRKYQREYRKRKKLEKQLNEVETTLF